MYLRVGHKQGSDSTVLVWQQMINDSLPEWPIRPGRGSKASRDPHGRSDESTNHERYHNSDLHLQ